MKVLTRSFIIPLILFCFFSIETFAQSKTVMMFNSRGLEDDRYEDMRGSPYLFEKWKYGKTVNSKSEIIDSLEMNYNGHTHNIEIRRDGKFIELDAYHYPLIVLYEGSEKEEIFLRRSSTASLLNRYNRMVFNGLEFSVVEDFNVRIETKKVNDVGIIRETNSFVGRKNYYIIKDNKAKLLKLKKKQLLQTLGNEGELDDFLKKTRNRLKTEEDLIALFKFFDQKGFIYN